MMQRWCAHLAIAFCADSIFEAKRWLLVVRRDTPTSAFKGGIRRGCTCSGCRDHGQVPWLVDPPRVSMRRRTAGVTPMRVACERSGHKRARARREVVAWYEVGVPHRYGAPPVHVPDVSFGTHSPLGHLQLRFV